MKAPVRFLAGCGIAALLAAAGYWLALEEPLQALAAEERTGEQMRLTVTEARSIARQKEALAVFNQRLRRAAGANSVDTAPRSAATMLAEASQRMVAAGGVISGIYPQPAQQACGFRVLVPPQRVVPLLREVERTLAWQLVKLEMKKADDGRMELYLLLEFGR